MVGAVNITAKTVVIENSTFSDCAAIGPTGKGGALRVSAEEVGVCHDAMPLIIFSLYASRLLLCLRDCMLLC